MNRNRQSGDNRKNYSPVIHSYLQLHILFAGAPAHQIIQVHGAGQALLLGKICMDHKGFEYRGLTLLAHRPTRAHLSWEYQN